MKTIITSALMWMLIFSTNAQDSLQVGSKSKSLNLQPIVALQLWSNYSFGQKIYNGQTNSYDPVDDRLNTQIRRTNIGVKGNFQENISFNITGAFDFIGRDVLAATQGGTNNGAGPAIGLWNAWMQWKGSPKNEAFNITAGYFAVQIGRASISPGFTTSSFEKSWTQNYVRRHITGIGPGRAVGINFGGLFFKNKITLGYDVGIFNPNAASNNGNSTGEKFSSLFAGRIVLQIGDPESKRYKLGTKSNYMGKRKGFSIAAAASHQGATDLFDQNQAFGVDWLFNWGNFNLDGELTYLMRNREKIDDPSSSVYESSANTGYIRLSYLIDVKGKFLEPSVTLMQFNGAMSAEEQLDAAQLNTLAGKDNYIEIALHYHLHPKLRISGRLTLNNGEAGANGNGFTRNNYFFQGGAGAIQRGDLVGIGVMAML